jgi:hypothetical protein
VSGPTPAVRDAVLRRDEGRCVVCGATVAADDGDRMRPLSGWYSLQHRVARGMGGRSVIDEPYNLLTVCGTGTTGCHGRIESHPEWARTQGYRVDSWDAPETVPVALCVAPGMYAWFALDDEHRVALTYRRDPRDPLATVHNTPQPDLRWMNPDCRDGKHVACSGDAWDLSADALTRCLCDCHGGPR